MSRHLRAGFSLVEVLIALAVAALLASLAYPSYVAQVQRARRADGTLALLELAHVLERFASERGTYAGATLGAAGVYPDTSRSGPTCWPSRQRPATATPSLRNPAARSWATPAAPSNTTTWASGRSWRPAPAHQPAGSRHAGQRWHPAAHPSKKR